MMLFTGGMGLAIYGPAIVRAVLQAEADERMRREAKRMDEEIRNLLVYGTPHPEMLANPQPSRAHARFAKDRR